MRRSPPTVETIDAVRGQACPPRPFGTATFMVTG